MEVLLLAFDAVNGKLQPRKAFVFCQYFVIAILVVDYFVIVNQWVSLPRWADVLLTCVVFHLEFDGLAGWLWIPVFVGNI